MFHVLSSLNSILHFLTSCIESAKFIVTVQALGEGISPLGQRILATLAKSLNLDISKFTRDLNSPEVQQQLESEMLMGRKLGAQGFPSMIFVKEGQAQYLPLDYNSSDNVIAMIKSLV